MPVQPSQAGIVYSGGSLPMLGAKLKKGRVSAALFLVFFAPCRTGRLYDWGRYAGSLHPSTPKNTASLMIAQTKKAAPFKGRGQSDREEVTAGHATKAHPTGMTLAQKG
jgi:hypothetical protein